MATLFTVPIPTGGSFTCTQPAPSVYLLSFSSPPDNRLTPAFNSTFLLSLDILQHRHPPGVVITTSAISKFYSNGLDYEAAIADPAFFPNSLFPLWARLLTFPMPTLALLNGHAFAGGLMLAMFQDYRLMNPAKGFLCLNELDFGAQLRPAMASIFRSKISMSNFRNMVLESRRYPAADALNEGIVDATGGLEEALRFVEERKLVVKAKSPSYGKLKEELYREAVKDLAEGCDPEFLPRLEGQREKEREANDKVARRRVEEYEAQNQKAKL